MLQPQLQNNTDLKTIIENIQQLLPNEIILKIGGYLPPISRFRLLAYLVEKGKLAYLPQKDIVEINNQLPLTLRIRFLAILKNLETKVPQEVRDSITLEIKAEKDKAPQIKESIFTKIAKTWSISKKICISCGIVFGITGFVLAMSGIKDQDSPLVLSSIFGGGGLSILSCLMPKFITKWCTKAQSNAGFNKLKAVENLEDLYNDYDEKSGLLSQKQPKPQYQSTDNTAANTALLSVISDDDDELQHPSLSSSSSTSSSQPASTHKSPTFFQPAPSNQSSASNQSSSSSSQTSPNQGVTTSQAIRDEYDKKIKALHFDDALSGGDIVMPIVWV